MYVKTKCNDLQISETAIVFKVEPSKHMKCLNQEIESVLGKTELLYLMLPTFLFKVVQLHIFSEKTPIFFLQQSVKTRT